MYLIFATSATSVVVEILLVIGFATSLKPGVVNLVIVELLLTRSWLVNLFLCRRPALALVMRPSLALLMTILSAELIPILVSVPLVWVVMPPIILLSPTWTFLPLIA